MSDINGSGYRIRYARRLNSGIDAPNLPIAFTEYSWEDYLAKTEEDPDIAWPMVTTTGQVIMIQAASCGLDCKCALEWWTIKD